MARTTAASTQHSLTLLLARSSSRAGTARLSAAVRSLEAGVAEVKRMFVADGARKRGIGRAILGALELAAIGLGYRVARLETGIRQPEAIGLYESAGYRRIDCYGRYASNELSVCYEKELR